MHKHHVLVGETCTPRPGAWTRSPFVHSQPRQTPSGDNKSTTGPPKSKSCNSNKVFLTSLRIQPHHIPTGPFQSHHNSKHAVEKKCSLWWYLHYSPDTGHYVLIFLPPSSSSEANWEPRVRRVSSPPHACVYAVCFHQFWKLVEYHVLNRNAFLIFLHWATQDHINP